MWRWARQSSVWMLPNRTWRKPTNNKILHNSWSSHLHWRNTQLKNIDPFPVSLILAWKAAKTSYEPEGEAWIIKLTGYRDFSSERVLFSLKVSLEVETESCFDSINQRQGAEEKAAWVEFQRGSGRRPAKYMKNLPTWLLAPSTALHITWVWNFEKIFSNVFPNYRSLLCCKKKKNPKAIEKQNKTILPHILSSSPNTVLVDINSSSYSGTWFPPM